MGQQKLSIFDKLEEEFYHLLTCAFSHITLPYPVITLLFYDKNTNCFGNILSSVYSLEVGIHEV